MGLDHKKKRKKLLDQPWLEIRKKIVEEKQMKNGGKFQRKMWSR